jgi:hypothetical protein
VRGRGKKKERVGREAGGLSVIISGKASRRDERLEAGSPASFYGLQSQKQAKKKKPQPSES